MAQPTREGEYLALMGDLQSRLYVMRGREMRNELSRVEFETFLILDTIQAILKQLWVADPPAKDVEMNQVQVAIALLCDLRNRCEGRAGEGIVDECKKHDQCRTVRDTGLVVCPWCGYKGVDSSNPGQWCAGCYTLFRVVGDKVHFSKHHTATWAESIAIAFAKAGGAVIAGGRVGYGEND